MVRPRRDLLLLGLLVATVAAGIVTIGSAQPAVDHQKRVLVLFTGRKDAQFSIVAERRLPLLLNEGLTAGVDYYSEFIDSPRFSEPEYQKAYRDFLSLKYQTQPLDLVIAIGTAAWQLLATNRDRLFPDTPVVFYVLQPPSTSMRNSTGIVNELQFGRSLELALTLQPNAKHVYVVS